MMIRPGVLTAVLALFSGSMAAWELPRPTGPHPVGRRVFEWTREAGHHVMAWVWYPAAAAPRTTAEVLPEKWGRLRRPTLQRRLGPEAAAAVTSARQWFVPDAPLPGEPRTFPVLLFSPGLSWLPVDYSALAAELASHGYVVAGVAPSGFAGPVVLASGEIIEQSRGPGDQALWEQDLRFALDRIARLQTAADSPFLGRLALDRLGLFGHSMGGAASMVVAAGNPGVTGAANLDGDFMGAARQARPKQRLLLLSHRAPESKSLLGLFDRSEERRTEDWKGVSSRSKDAQRLALEDSFHLDFLDAALLPAGMIPPKLRANRFSARPGTRTLALTAGLLQDFFSGRPTAASAARFPELTPLSGSR